jgi:CDGSH-type Zn-finger protein
MDVTIKVRKNGPILVTGTCLLTDHEGNEIVPKNRENFTLCRCGGSQTKPFCDGTHKTNGFQDPV